MDKYSSFLKQRDSKIYEMLKELKSGELYVMQLVNSIIHCDTLLIRFHFYQQCRIHYDILAVDFSSIDDSDKAQWIEFNTDDNDLLGHDCDARHSALISLKLVNVSDLPLFVSWYCTPIYEKEIHNAEAFGRPLSGRKGRDTR